MPADGRWPPPSLYVEGQPAAIGMTGCPSEMSNVWRAGLCEEPAHQVDGGPDEQDDQGEAYHDGYGKEPCLAVDL